MNELQLKLSQIFLIALIGFTSSIIIATNIGNAQTMESYKIIDVYIDFILQCNEI